jgi:hypothetical protein
MTRSKGRLAWLLAGLAAMIATIATAGTSLWYLTAFQADMHMHSVTQTVSYQGRPGLINVQLSDGDITIKSGPPGRVGVTRELQWSGGRPVPEERWNGHTLSIGQNCPDSWDSSCTVNYTIAVPPGVTVDLETDSGNITADDVRVAQAQASSDSGDVQLSFASAPDSIWASSESGNVTVLVPSGGSYALDSRAANGNSSVDILSNPTDRRSITVISDDGNIAVGYN